MNNNYLKDLFIHKFYVNQNLREKKNKHQSAVLWFTGLSGSGKSTIASFLEKKLYEKGISTYLLDGDNIRSGLCNDLSFSKKDRIENMRRVTEVVKLMIDAGLIVLVSLISPYKKDRLRIKNILQKKNFFEIFINTPLEICQKRDPKNLYKNAILGNIQNFTGISSLYEPPDYPDISINGSDDLNSIVNKIIKILIKNNIIN
ncbi:Adenylyl-sulfate kinase [Buchnera aphidicola (Thelaxes suberi)]|uniref:adenylyl-sulfate kinase n=1 Tax=Buchnera aphidicola TaxID=9 RepID=UPI00346493B3